MFRKISRSKCSRSSPTPPNPFLIFLCFQSDPRKAENFDSQFKRLPMISTPPDATAKFILNNLKGDEFKGFSFYNEAFGDYCTSL